MAWGREPEFLSREIVDAIHEHQIDTYGGLHGVRDENALESAIGAAQTFIITVVVTCTKLPPPTPITLPRVKPIWMAARKLVLKLPWSSWGFAVNRACIGIIGHTWLDSLSAVRQIC